MEEGDLVLCTVDKIEGTTVFVKLSTGETGTIVTSEIAPGRIRNIKEYVVPNKKIVCKVLRLSGNNIELSLRRVNSREKKAVMTEFQQEQTAKSALNSILKDKAEEVKEKVMKDFKSLFEFLSKTKEDESLIKKYIPAEFHEQIKKVLQKRKKDIEVKKIVNLKCFEDDGIKRIKRIFPEKTSNIEIIYIAAGKFQINLKDENYKNANHKMNEIIENIEKLAKENHCELESIEEKK